MEQTRETNWSVAVFAPIVTAEPSVYTVVQLVILHDAVGCECVCVCVFARVKPRGS